MEKTDDCIKKPYVIAVGCLARVGKDSLADLLKEKLESRGFSVIKYSLATPLKYECDEFFRLNYGISAFTEKDEDKNLIRPILVEVGRAHRKQTEGRYFTKLADEVIDKQDADFIIVPDLRFHFYDFDEFSWLKNRGGYFIYLDRITPNGNTYKAANSDEEENSKRLINVCDHYLYWNDFGVDLDCAREQINGLDEKILEHFKVDYAKSN